MGPFGFWELLVVFAVLLLLFGARRLPEMGKSLGRGMREFKDAVTSTDVQESTEIPARTTAPAPTPTPPPATTQTPPPNESERVSSSSSN